MPPDSGVRRISSVQHRRIAKTGKVLWHFQAGQLWKASPMTYLAGWKGMWRSRATANVLALA
jgi:hypothetical protein